MAHTTKVIGLGILLLALCLIVGRLVGGPVHPRAIAHAAIVFIPLWLIGAGVNLWYGVSKAGYRVAEELPYFVVVFLVPAGLAVLACWWYSTAG